MAPIAAFIVLATTRATTTGSDVVVDEILTSITKDGYVFVRVSAAGGQHQGWGQCSYNNEHTDLGNTTASKVHEWLGPLVLGKSFTSPDDVAAFADAGWRANYKRTGSLLARALAGLDTALWDLIARSRNASVCSLVAASFGPGRECKSSVPVYGSNGDRKKSPSDIVDNAVHNQQKYGVQAFKFQIMQRMGRGVDIKPNRTEELIPLARQRLGPEATLMVDANGGFANISQAFRMAQLLAANNYTWLEEPLPFWQYEDTGKLGAQMAPLGVGIALGEQEYREDVWERNIGSMTYAQPDVHYVGGLSRALR
eukprot:g4930.t1